MSPDQLGVWVGFGLTLMIFSYLLGDNFLYRIAVYVFVGLAAAYVTIIAIESVIRPWLQATIFSGDPGGVAVGLIPPLLGLLLFMKATGRLARLSSLGLAFLIGLGTAVALVGAISGTLIPLAAGVITGAQTDLVNGVLIILGVLSTLVAFQYLGRRQPDDRVRRPLPVRVFGAVGQGVIAVTLGALYGGAVLTSLAILSERVAFVLTTITGG
ncbi:MAG: hypothetical protein NZM00_06680 [Anaerolinea sp.]|nr:hypothetical protein [Anaerolinea sp.]